MRLNFLFNEFLNRFAFTTTVIDDSAMAISAMTGCSRPITATGIAIVLYANAQNRFCLIFLNVDLDS